MHICHRFNLIFEKMEGGILCQRSMGSSINPAPPPKIITPKSLLSTKVPRNSTVFKCLISRTRFVQRQHIIVKIDCGPTESRELIGRVRSCGYERRYARVLTDIHEESPSTQEGISRGRKQGTATDTATKWNWPEINDLPHLVPDSEEAKGDAPEHAALRRQHYTRKALSRLERLGIVWLEPNIESAWGLGLKHFIISSYGHTLAFSS
jgi:hypothetical protein